jgi:hypothetical protein
MSLTCVITFSNSELNSGNFLLQCLCFLHFQTHSNSNLRVFVYMLYNSRLSFSIGTASTWEEGVPGCHNLVPFLNPLLLSLSGDGFPVAFDDDALTDAYISAAKQGILHLQSPSSFQFFTSSVPITHTKVVQLGAFGFHVARSLIWSGPKSIISFPETLLILFYFSCLFNDVVSRQYPWHISSLTWALSTKCNAVKT